MRNVTSLQSSIWRRLHGLNDHDLWMTLTSSKYQYLDQVNGTTHSENFACMHRPLQISEVYGVNMEDKSMNDEAVHKYRHLYFCSFLDITSCHEWLLVFGDLYISFLHVIKPSLYIKSIFMPDASSTGNILEWQMF